MADSLKENKVLDAKNEETSVENPTIKDFSGENDTDANGTKIIDAKVEDATESNNNNEANTDGIGLKAMTKDFIMDVMSVPASSYNEYRMVTYIMLWCRARGIKYEFDTKGNIYLTKGELAEGEYYPCLTSHLDTVQTKQTSYAQAGLRLPIKEREAKGKHEIYVDGMGIGADCRAGIAISLALIEKFDTIKACFFLEEEVGMGGSKELNVRWFDDVGYVMGYDSPEQNRAAYCCSNATLFTRTFFEEHLEEICKKHGLVDFRSEPFTDVVQIRNKTDIVCMNFGNGGYNAHSSNEYCVLEDMDTACAMGKELIEHLGKSKYICPKVDDYKPKDGVNETEYSYYARKGGRTTTTYGSGYGTVYRSGGYSYSGGSTPSTQSTNKVTTPSTPSSTQTKSAESQLEIVKHVSEVYETRLEDIKTKVMNRCKEYNIEFDELFANIFAEEIKF